MEKRKHKFNIIDLLIIIGIVLFALSLYSWLFSNKTQSEDNGKTVNIQYVIQSEQMPEDMADNIAVGDKVFDYTNGHEIGTVKSCDVRNATYVGTSSDGKEVISDVPGYCTLYITVDAVALSTEGSYEVSGSAVAAGCDYQLMFPNLYCKGNCVSIEIAG